MKKGFSVYAVIEECKDTGSRFIVDSAHDIVLAQRIVSTFTIKNEIKSQHEESCTGLAVIPLSNDNTKWVNEGCVKIAPGEKKVISTYAARKFERMSIICIKEAVIYRGSEDTFDLSKNVINTNSVPLIYTSDNPDVEVDEYTGMAVIKGSGNTNISIVPRNITDCGEITFTFISIIKDVSQFIKALRDDNISEIFLEAVDFQLPQEEEIKLNRSVTITGVAGESGVPFTNINTLNFIIDKEIDIEIRLKDLNVENPEENGITVTGTDEGCSASLSMIIDNVYFTNNDTGIFVSNISESEIIGGSFEERSRRIEGYSEERALTVDGNSEHDKVKASLMNVDRDIIENGCFKDNNCGMKLENIDRTLIRGMDFEDNSDKAVYSLECRSLYLDNCTVTNMSYPEAEGLYIKDLHDVAEVNIDKLSFEGFEDDKRIIKEEFGTGKININMNVYDEHELAQAGSWDVIDVLYLKDNIDVSSPIIMDRSGELILDGSKGNYMITAQNNMEKIISMQNMNKVLLKNIDINGNNLANIGIEMNDEGENKVNTEITGCLFTRNTDHGLYIFNARNVTIENSTFQQNGGGLTVEEVKNIKIQKCCIMGNEKGIYIEHDGSATIEESNFEDNSDTAVTAYMYVYNYYGTLNINNSSIRCAELQPNAVAMHLVSIYSHSYYFPIAVNINKTKFEGFDHNKIICKDEDTGTEIIININIYDEAELRNAILWDIIDNIYVMNDISLSSDIVGERNKEGNLYKNGHLIDGNINVTNLTIHN
jgi:parallel beta-helix repeat protein